MAPPNSNYARTANDDVRGLKEQIVVIKKTAVFHDDVCVVNRNSVSVKRIKHLEVLQRDVAAGDSNNIASTSDYVRRYTLVRNDARVNALRRLIYWQGWGLSLGRLAHT
jgi:hypothetical protein